MKARHEREVEMMPLENVAAIPQETMRPRARSLEKIIVHKVRFTALALVFGLTGLGRTGEAQFSPDWISRVPVGTSLSSGTAGIYVDPDGTSYVTGTSGSSSNTDITTV